MPALAMLAACFLWASAVPATKLAVDEIAAGQFVVLRLLLAAGGLWLMVVATRAKAQFAIAGWRPIIMGALEPGLVTFMVSVGLTMSSPVNGAVFWSLTPLIMPLLARVVLGERLEPVIIAAALVAAAATGLLVYGQIGHGGGSLVGDTLLIGGVTASCVSALIARRTAQAGANPLVTSSWQVTAACGVTALLLATVPTGSGSVIDASPAALGALVYLGLGVTTAVFVLSNYAYRHLAVGRISLFSCVVGPVGTALSAAVLGTPVTLLDTAAIALVTLAVALPYLVRR
jgi:drug/metabolite transporter (DMT)-like permease